MKKFYITTPIYYVNDKPHIGHAYTTVAADVIARYHKLKEEKVFFLTGADEHGTKVAESAKKQGENPQEFCNEMSQRFKDTWKKLNISNNDFIRTTSKRHIKGVEKFLKELKRKGLIYKGEYKGLYCIGCEKFITEKELVDGKCPIHQKRPEVISEKNYFFKLSKYLDKVQKLIQNDEIEILPKERKNETLGLIKQGLEDFSISREKVKWGIKIPWDDQQTVYVWIDALLNYITALDYGDNQKKFKKFWPADSPAVLQLLGKDILKFHTIYWPALLLALNIKPPKKLFVHGYFTISGRKMSKSLGNIITPEEMIEKFGVDGTRYLLMSAARFGQDADVSWDWFKEKYNADLANGIGNTVNRVLTMVEKYFNGIIPEDKPIPMTLMKKTLGQPLKVKSKDTKLGLKDSIKKNILTSWSVLDNLFHFDICLGQIIEGFRENFRQIDKDISDEEPWNPRADMTQKVFYSWLESIRLLAFMLLPFMPETSNKIFKQLGIPGEEKETLAKAQKWGRLKPGARIKKGKPLFPRIK